MSALASVVSDETGPYRPSDSEPFMNERQQAYFKKKLLAWKDEILRESKGTVVNLKAETENHPDLVDRASSESDRALELRTRDRQRKLVSKIDAALRRIETGDYGYCEMTGEPISLKRLDARPIATLTLEAQERHERRERTRDRRAFRRRRSRGRRFGSRRHLGRRRADRDVQLHQSDLLGPRHRAERRVPLARPRAGRRLR